MTRSARGDVRGPAICPDRSLTVGSLFLACRTWSCVARGATSASGASRRRWSASSTRTRSRSCGARFELDPEAPARRPRARAAERLAAQVRHERRARRGQLHAEMTERAAAEGLEFRFEPLARRQHLRRPPPDPPRRHLRPPGGREGAADARLLHRGRGDRRSRDAGPARGRGRRRRGRGARRAGGATASPTTCARTSCSPRGSASRACRSSCSTAASASRARSRPRCSSQALERAWEGGYSQRVSYSVLPAGEAFWRPSNQMGVLNTDLGQAARARPAWARASGGCGPARPRPSTAIG